MDCWVIMLIHLILFIICALCTLFRRTGPFSTVPYLSIYLSVYLSVYLPKLPQCGPDHSFMAEASCAGGPAGRLMSLHGVNYVPTLKWLSLTATCTEIKYCYWTRHSTSISGEYVTTHRSRSFWSKWVGWSGGRTGFMCTHSCVF